MPIPIVINTYFCLSGLILGAVCMYLLDPERGQRRRTMLRARFMTQLHQLSCLIDTRLYGPQHRMRDRASKALRRHN
jgi:hypothetical protein